MDVLFNGLERNVFVDSSVEPGEEVRIRLAGLLPGLSRWSSLALRGLPCELVDVSVVFVLPVLWFANFFFPCLECFGDKRVVVSLSYCVFEV